MSLIYADLTLNKERNYRKSMTAAIHLRMFMTHLETEVGVLQIQI